MLSAPPRELLYPTQVTGGKVIKLPPKVNHVFKVFLLENGVIARWQESSVWYWTGISWSAPGHESVHYPSGWWVNHRTGGLLPRSAKLKQKQLQFVMWCITLIDLWILKNPCILGINPTWSWCMILLMCCWVWFTKKKKKERKKEKQLPPPPPRHHKKPPKNSCGYAQKEQHWL